MYQTINLCKAFGRPPQTVLNQVNLNIPTGSLFGLLGPNGAGKTTLISILAGLLPKTSGQVLINGVELQSHIREMRSTTGMVPQDLALYPMLTAKDNLDFFADALGLRGATRQHNIDFAVTTTMLEDFLNKKVQNFSGGLKRRLNLAIGLLNQPSVLFLDEPTVGIDPQTRSFILQSIKLLNQEGMTVIYSSHYMDEVQQICDHVAIIDHGSILVQGDIHHLLHQHQSELRVAFNTAQAERLQHSLAAHCAAQSDDPYTLRIETNDPLTTLQKIAEQLPDSATTVTRINYGSQNLEELFLSLTGRETRDGDVG